MMTLGEFEYLGLRKNIFGESHSGLPKILEIVLDADCREGLHVSQDHRSQQLLAQLSRFGITVPKDYPFKYFASQESKLRSCSSLEWCSVLSL